LKTKSLQKLTKTDTKIDSLLSLQKVTKADLQPLTEKEKDKLNQVLTDRLRTLKGAERDEFLNKIEDITGKETKNQLWESNHIVILNTISSFMQNYARMPSIVEIATATDLSRQTVNKHLDNFKQHPIHKQQIERFKLMSSSVLAKVYQYAMRGDIKACKLYFNVMGMLNNDTSQTSQIENQNNYIQINGLTLSQETVKDLNPEQVNFLEEIIKTVSPKPRESSIIENQRDKN